jgi:hypothetical protein
MRCRLEVTFTNCIDNKDAAPTNLSKVEVWELEHITHSRHDKLQKVPYRSPLVPMQAAGKCVPAHCQTPHEWLCYC